MVDIYSHCHRKPLSWAAASGFWDLKPELWAVTGLCDGLWWPRLPTAWLSRLKALSLSWHNTNVDMDLRHISRFLLFVMYHLLILLLDCTYGITSHNDYHHLNTYRTWPLLSLPWQRQWTGTTIEGSIDKRLKTCRYVYFFSFFSYSTNIK